MWPFRKSDSNNVMHDGIIELKKLELNLEHKARSDYSKSITKIKKCKSCHVAPVHSYDSFGMPMHKLECPKCGAHVEFPKDMRATINRWNARQDGTAGKIKCNRCVYHRVYRVTQAVIDRNTQNNHPPFTEEEIRNIRYHRCVHPEYMDCSEEQYAKDPEYYLAICEIVNSWEDCNLFKLKKVSK